MVYGRGARTLLPTTALYRRDPRNRFILADAVRVPGVGLRSRQVPRRSPVADTNLEPGGCVYHA